MVTVRPSAELVHWAARGQPAHALPNTAAPPPALAGRMGTVTAPGQVTVPAPRSMVKRSLANRPAGAFGGCTLVLIWAPAFSSFANNSPAPWAASPYTASASSRPP